MTDDGICLCWSLADIMVALGHVAILSNAMSNQESRTHDWLSPSRWVITILCFPLPGRLILMMGVRTMCDWVRVQEEQFGKIVHWRVSKTDPPVPG